MKFYLTSETQFRLHNNLTNINTFFVVDVDNIIKSLDLDITKQHNIFLVNSEISKLIISAAKVKKYKGIIYINSNISKNVLDNIKKIISNIPTIDDIVLLDDYNLPKLKHLYSEVDEIMYFSTFRRIRIIECKSIKDLQ